MDSRNILVIRNGYLRVLRPPDDMGSRRESETEAIFRAIQNVKVHDAFTQEKSGQHLAFSFQLIASETSPRGPQRLLCTRWAITSRGAYISFNIFPVWQRCQPFCKHPTLCIAQIGDSAYVFWHLLRNKIYTVHKTFSILHIFSLLLLMIRQKVIYFL